LTPRTKLTVSLDSKILERAKREARNKRIPLSQAIENFLSFFVDPTLYCFKCAASFTPTGSSVCAKCGWLSCPKCGACRCVLGEEAAVTAFHMRKVYEQLCGGRLK
jgi:hypothetical protein